MNMRRRSNSCREHRENISLLASSALPEAEQVAVRNHMAHCPACRQYYDEMVGVSGALQQWAQTELPVEADAAFRTRWMQSIQGADAPARTSLAALIYRCGEWFWPSPVAWGALAGVWICLLWLHLAAPAQRVTGHNLATRPSSGTEIRFAQRQRELASLLESLAAPEASKPDQPRPRSERRAESVRG